MWLPRVLRRVSEKLRLHRELKDAHWQLGNIIEEVEQLKGQLLASSDELTVVHLVTGEAKKAWEEERSYAVEQDRRAMPTYMEFEGFFYGLECASQVTYGFGNHITLKHFEARYLELEVAEDPFVELPSNTEVPAPTEVPFDDRPTTLALHPTS
ncbi:hypothetical protein BHE74_00054747 [Ensete ventricosum]|nr:hypothetical protein BHE74_00054747 [Ensete ventricosum]